MTHLAAGDLSVHPAESLRNVADRDPLELVPDVQPPEDGRSAAGHHALIFVDDADSRLRVVRLSDEAVQPYVSVALQIHIAPAICALLQPRFFAVAVQLVHPDLPFSACLRRLPVVVANAAPVAHLAASNRRILAVESRSTNGSPLGVVLDFQAALDGASASRYHGAILVHQTHSGLGIVFVRVPEAVEPHVAGVLAQAVFVLVFSIFTLRTDSGERQVIHLAPNRAVLQALLFAGAVRVVDVD